MFTFIFDYIQFIFVTGRLVPASFIFKQNELIPLEMSIDRQ